MSSTAKTAPALKASRTRKPKAAAAPPLEARESDSPPEAAPVPTPSGKLGVVVGLLRREGGATLADLQAATGWQAHSVRGALAGAVKKKLALAVLSEKADGVRRYRIAS